MSSCANCGKGEEDSIKLKTCTACKAVKYCNAACQKAHRPQHKNECRKRAVELQDEDLFKQTREEDCPICCIRLPASDSGKRYQVCCGKVICSGCMFGVQVRDDVDTKCPFCRVPTPYEVETEIFVERFYKRMEFGDTEAMYHIGYYHMYGDLGFPLNPEKAFELFIRAADLGHASANYQLGKAYFLGQGPVERDVMKAIHYKKLAAMGGDLVARHSLGLIEAGVGNMDKALKHYMIALKSGYKTSLDEVRSLYTKGRATKKDYENALRSWQAYLDEIRSDQRDEAANCSSGYQYIDK